MLHGNGSVLHELPLRFFAGSTASVEPQLRGNWGKNGSTRNRLYPDKSNVSLKLYAIPDGTYAGTAWMLPQCVGAISSHNSASSVAGASVTLAGGKNLTAQADSVSTATGTGYVLSNLAGSSPSVSTATGALFGTAPLSGTAPSVSTATGTVTAPGAVAGSAASVSGATLSAVAILPASGSAASTSTANGSLFAASFMTAQADSISAASGSAFGVRFGSGSAASISGASGAISGIGWTIGTAASTSTASMGSYATGSISGESTTVQALSPDGLAKAVWNSVALQFNVSGSMGSKLNSAASGGIDYAALGLAVWQHSQRELTGIADANMVQVRGQALVGDGSDQDPWNPA